MNKLAVIWLMIGIGIGAIMFQENIIYAVQYDYDYLDRGEIKEMIYAIPPTPAWSVFELNDTLDTQGDLIDADSFNRKMYLITDGSIEINRGVGGNP